MKNNDVVEWYTKNYKDKSCSRFETFKLALGKVYEYTDTPLILETGTLRLEDDFGAGYSTYIFGECVSIFGGNLITVDVVENHMNVSKKLTDRFKYNIEYVLDDSVSFLNGFDQKIDLLYLDSMDCPIEGDATIAQKHNLKEFLESEKNLHDNSVILIDDVNFPNGGKAKLTHEHLHNLNYNKLVSDQQSVWMK